MPKCRVPDSFTLRRVTRDGKGPQSCQLASNLCIQRHLNAVAKGTERKKERERGEREREREGSQNWFTVIQSVSQFV